MVSTKTIFAVAVASLLFAALEPAIAQDTGSARTLGGRVESNSGAPDNNSNGAAALRPGDPIPGIDIITDQGGRALDDDSDGDSIDTTDDTPERTN